MCLISNFAVIFSLENFLEISFIFTQRFKLICTCTTFDLQVLVKTKLELIEFKLRKAIESQRSTSPNF